MGAVHGLRIVLARASQWLQRHRRGETHRRIPVGIVEDDGVGCGQIDTQTSSAGREQENEELRSARPPQIASATVPFVVPQETHFVCQSMTISRRSEIEELPSSRKYLY